MKNQKSEKIYLVKIGSIDPDGRDLILDDSKRVIAKDALSASKKVRLRKGTYFSSIEFENRLG